MAKARASKPRSRPKRLWISRVSLPGVVAAVVGAAVTTMIGRATGAGWDAAIGLGGLLGGGLYLWAADRKKGWGDLGEGIFVSVVVAVALMAVQRDADER